MAFGGGVRVDYDSTRIIFSCVNLQLQSFVNGIVHIWGPGVVAGGATAGGTSADIGAGASLDSTAVATGASGAPVVYQGLITSGGPAGQPCTYDFFGPA